jgi:hypothetical protein
MSVNDKSSLNDYTTRFFMKSAETPSSNEFEVFAVVNIFIVASWNISPNRVFWTRLEIGGRLG